MYQNCASASNKSSGYKKSISQVYGNDKIIFLIEVKCVHIYTKKNNNIKSVDNRKMKNDQKFYPCPSGKYFLFSKSFIISISSLVLYNCLQIIKDHLV